MIGASRFRLHRTTIFGILLVSVVVAMVNEVLRDHPVIATGTARVATPDVDRTRPTAQAVDFDALVQEQSAAHPAMRIVRISDERIQVFASGTDAVQDVGSALEDLADAAVRQQVDAGFEADEQLAPRLFIRIPGPASGGASTAADSSEVEGTLVLESRTARNPIESVGMATRLMQVIATSDDGRARLQDELGDGASYSFRVPGRISEGLMDVAVTASDPQVAVSGFDEVVSFLEGELRSRQAAADVPQRDQYIIEVVDRPLEAVPLTSGPHITTLLILALGIGLAVATRRLLTRQHAGHGQLGAAEAPSGVAFSSVQSRADTSDLTLSSSSGSVARSIAASNSRDGD